MYRLEAENNSAMLPTTVQVWDGHSKYTIYPTFAIKDDSTSPSKAGFKQYYFGSNPKDRLAAVNGIDDTFGGVACVRFSRPNTQSDWTPIETSADVRNGTRNDFVDKTTGRWIGYSVVSGDEVVMVAKMLTKIRTDEIPMDSFAPPPDGIPIREVSSPKEFSKAVIKGMQPALKEYGIEYQGRFRRFLIPSLVLLTAFMFAARYVYIRVKNKEN